MYRDLSSNGLLTPIEAETIVTAYHSQGDPVGWISGHNCPLMCPCGAAGNSRRCSRASLIDFRFGSQASLPSRSLVGKLVKYLSGWNRVLSCPSTAHQNQLSKSNAHLKSIKNKKLKLIQN